jgi:imidazolonepropionase-like amidohydrolase
MAPVRIEEPPVSWPTVDDDSGKPFEGFPRNIKPIDAIAFDESLQPKHYDIFGTHRDSKILFLDVNILDSTGREPYRGDVLIEGERISYVGDVPDVETLKNDSTVRVFHGKGRTLMSGLGDAHTHFTWNGGDLNALGEMGVEEHTLLTMRSAQCFLDSGYTMFAYTKLSDGRHANSVLRCFGAASAKKRLDVVIRDAINAGDIPGPRYLANGQEMARTDGELVAPMTAFADGPDQMRKVIREHVDIGVDNIKLSMSGEEVSTAVVASSPFPPRRL